MPLAHLRAAGSAAGRKVRPSALRKLNSYDTVRSQILVADDFWEYQYICLLRREPSRFDSNRLGAPWEQSRRRWLHPPFLKVKSILCAADSATNRVATRVRANYAEDSNRR